MKKRPLQVLYSIKLNLMQLATECSYDSDLYAH